MLIIKRLAILVFLFCILFSKTTYAKDLATIQGWQMHSGDLTIDEKGDFEFNSLGQDLWIPIDLDKKMQIGSGIYWLKVKLPQFNAKNIYMFFTTSGNHVEIFMEDMRIYSYGDFKHFRRMVEFVQHLVPLPYDASEKTVYIRISNDFSNLDFIAKYTGFTNFFGKISIGLLEDYQLNIIDNGQNSEHYLGHIIFFIGVIAIVVFFVSRRESRANLYFCGVTLISGIYLITHNRFTFGKLVFGKFTNYTLTIGLYLILFFITGFIREYFNIKKDKIFSFLYWAQLLHIMLILPLDIMNIAPTALFFYVFLIFALFTVLYIILFLIKLSFHGDRNAKVVIGGFILASIVWIFDLYKWITNLENFTNQPMVNMQWGVFIFTSSIGYVLINRYIDTHNHVLMMNKELMDIQENIVIMLGETVEARSGETGEHLKRVADISVRIAAKYGFKDEELKLIKLASPMHDIGKIAIPDYILNKPGRLSEDEYDIIKTHTKVGYDILIRSNQRILNTAAIIALQHHEKYNGKGYPNGLRGDEIHILARITAIADVFDALTSERVYKKAYSIPEALRVIHEEKGQHFDPVLVDNFMEVAEELFPLKET